MDLHYIHPVLLTFALINTHPQNVRSPLSLLKKIWAPVHRFTHNRFFDLYVAVFIAVFVISFHGSGVEGQTGFFRLSLKGYIEETSASISTVAQSSHVIDINNLAFDGMGGEGPQVSGSPEVSFVQQNSVLAFAPASEDYADKGNFKRNQIVEYTVQGGDRLSFIASDYGVTMDSILWANKLSNVDSIKPGQILRIPPVTGVIYKVKSGDTVNSLAKQFGASEEKIISFNELDSGKLAVNDEIIIPDGKMPVKTAVAAVQKVRFSLLPDLGAFFMIPTTGFDWGKIHGRNGVDIANSCGTPIYAAADGKAVIATDQGWNGGFGKFIKLEHENGTETLYGHLSKLKIALGATVEKGQLIGNMGTTGNSTGCHLHFEVHGAQNPLAKK
ncbi:MAG: peptidoglycan DD-metalloendopeptidase family protein [Candidatus Yanofskybacteria bacterium]|nr:peptidoglycan DD-metalloendopeptidase family protein [Candidatus Yanofskybacteria bacterium]